ncbi:MAG TPA: phosphate ABC transporter permease subunit PstC [Gammaproteobacteria bacterium]|nr:phosphate ABC transporter permease subunit PstC [Gammaproteobacteria bacterium]
MDPAEVRAGVARRLRRGRLIDRWFARITWLSGVTVLALVLAITGSLVVGSVPIIDKFGLGFLASTKWNPVNDEFGAFTSIVGTLVTSLIAIVVAVPVSVGVSLFITELAPTWLKRPVGTAVELLAAIPSIIYGMWGLFVFAPYFADHVQPWMNAHLDGIPGLDSLLTGPPFGIGVLTAGFILAIMIIPFIAAVMRDVFEVVPPVLKESAYGLGATTWEVFKTVTLRYTKAGIVGGIMLGLGRALGETMAVTFVIGNSHKLHASLFMPGNTISSTLANEFTEATGQMYTSALIALGLILFFITFLVLAAARLMLLRMRAGEGKTA